MRLLTDEQHEYFASIVKGIPAKDAADKLNERFGTNFTVSQIRTYKKNHHLNSGLDLRFKPGHVSHNKGKKMSPEVIEKVKKTWFKVGGLPHNHLPVGSEVVSSDGYLKVKIAEPNKWEFKHRLIWLEHRGEIPKGKKIVFKDGNKLNCTIENLALVSNETHLLLNRLRIENRGEDVILAADDICRVEKKLKELRAGQTGEQNG